MKSLLFLLPLFCFANEKICIEYQVQKTTTCSSNTGSTLGGAGLGWLVLGPVGGVVGAIAGASGDKKCEEKEEKICVKYLEKKK